MRAKPWRWAALLLAVELSSHASKTQRPPGSGLVSFDVAWVRGPVHLNRFLTQQGLLRFRGTLINGSSAAVDVTPASTGTVSVSRFTCGGRDVRSFQHVVLFDEDPRAVQRQKAITLEPEQSTSLDEFLPRTVTFSEDDGAIETEYSVERAGTCEIVFEYRYGGAAHPLPHPIRSKPVTFEVLPEVVTAGRPGPHD